MSFDTEIVKDDNDVLCSDPPPVADKDSLLSPSVMKCSGSGEGSKFFLKQQSDMDEYEDNDYGDDVVHQIPCSQIRDVPCMLQKQNACCSFDKPYKPMNLTHLDSPHGDNTDDEQEEEEEDVKEEEDEEGETNGHGTGEDSNNG